MSNSEILNYQLDKFREVMEQYKKSANNASSLFMARGMVYFVKRYWMS